LYRVNDVRTQLGNLQTKNDDRLSL